MNKLKNIVEGYRFYLVGMFLITFGVIISLCNTFEKSIEILILATVLLSFGTLFESVRNKKWNQLN